jgi:hypothetical protein
VITFRNSGIWCPLAKIQNPKKDIAQICPPLCPKREIKKEVTSRCTTKDIVPPLLPLTKMKNEK